MTGFELYLKRNSRKIDDYLSSFFTDGVFIERGMRQEGQ